MTSSISLYKRLQVPPYESSGIFPQNLMVGVILIDVGGVRGKVKEATGNLP